MTWIKSSIFISKFGKVWNFVIQSCNKHYCFVFLHSSYDWSKIREESFLPCIVISNHFFRQLIYFIYKLFNDLMSYLMVLFNFIFLKQIRENVNILNSKVHSSVSKRRMNMGSVSSKIYISNVHLLNNSVINEELRPPTDVEYVKFFKTSIFQILRRITHDSYMILI